MTTEDERPAWPGPDEVQHGDTVARERPVDDVLALMGLADATDDEVDVALGAAHPTPAEVEP